MTTYYVQGDTPLGSELFTNNDFASGLIGWTRSDTNWDVPATTLIGTNAEGNFYQQLALTNGQTYRFEVDFASYTSGSLQLHVEGTGAVTLQSSQIQENKTVIYYTVTSTGFTGLNGISAWTGSVNSMSCKQVITGGSGTSNDPWQGLNSVDTSVFLPGDELIIMGTISRGSLVLDGVNGTAANPIKIRMHKDAVWNTKLGDDYKVLLKQFINMTNCSYVVLEGLRIEGAWQSEYWSDSWSGTISERPIGIFIPNDCSNVKILNCSFRDMPASAIYVLADNTWYIDVENCDFNNTGIGGIKHGGTSEARVIGNTFYKCGSGTAANNGDGCAIQMNVGNSYCMYNYIEDCGTRETNQSNDFQITCDGKTGHEDFGGPINGGERGEPVHIIGNILKDNKYGLVQIFYGMPYSYVAYNIFDHYNFNTGSGSDGINSAIRIGTTNTPDNATFDENNITIANNIFMNNKAGYWGADISFGLETGGVQDNLTIINNIFYNNDYAYYNTNDNASLNNLVIDYNCYYQPDGNYTNMWLTSRVAGGGDYDSFAAWQAGIFSADANGINLNPKLNTDYSLQIDSPCIGAGTPITWVQDNDGRYKAVVAQDIGAKHFEGIEDSTVNILLGSGGAI